MKVKLVHITPEAEKIIAFCARVSSPNQENPEYSKLISYLIKHRHWSPMEMANMCVEIETTRAISPQILRHRSFAFQEFSQRYSETSGHENYEARRQDVKNRQNSIDDLDAETKQWFDEVQEENWDEAYILYEQALDKGIAKELARNLLPLNSSTKLYMNGSIRSWIHYLEVRADVSTQKEHRDIALAIKEIFKEQLPEISKALGWRE